MNTKYIFLAAAAVTLMSATSFATPIANGGQVLAVPVSGVSASSVLDSQANNFTGVDALSNVVFTGTEFTTVYTGDVNNPLGGLTFYYSVVNDAGSTDALDLVSIAGFNGFLTDVGYVDPGGTFTPIVVTRSSTGVIGFNFSSIGFPNHDVLPGTSSAIMVVHTNALADVAVTMSIIDGGTGTASSFGPATTPEPTSLGVIGLGSLALIRRRRSR